jgi:hypothetical protein
MTIFERSSGALRATAGGRDFLRTARSILEQIDSPVNSTYNTGRGEAGPQLRSASVRNHGPDSFQRNHSLTLAPIDSTTIMTNPTGINQMRRRLIAGAAATTLLASAKWSAARAPAGGSIEALGLELPPISQPIANFVHSTRAGNLVFVSGQLPRKDGKMPNPGEVGACVTVEPAKEAATPRTLLASIRV